MFFFKFKLAELVFHIWTLQISFIFSILRNCKKIGEGVYGEVFMLKKRSRYSVLKIIPIEGDHIINGERQKKFDEVLSELVIAL